MRDRKEMAGTSGGNSQVGKRNREARLHRIAGILVAASALVALPACAAPSWAGPGREIEPEHFNPDMVDRAVDPCDDFEKFACSRWEAANPIPADERAWDTSGKLHLWNLEVLRQTLEQASVPVATRSEVGREIGDFWASCSDRSVVEAAARRDLPLEWARVDRLQDKRELAQAVAHLHLTVPGAWAGDNNQTDAALFGISSQQDFDDSSQVVVSIDQGGIALPGRSFYLDVGARSVALRAHYQRHVARMLALAGEDSQQAARDARAVLQIETELAAWQMDNVSRRDPDRINNKFSLERIKALTPDFDWAAYLSGVAVPASPHYLVSAPEFFEGVQRALRGHGLAEWKAYLHWRLVHGMAPYLSEALSDEDFAFFQGELNGARKRQPRWRRCVNTADAFLGEALGQAYVDRAFPPDSRRMVTEIVHDVEAAMAEDIRQLDWISPQTKQEALKKLAAIQDKIGYPERWRDYSSIAISRTSLLQNIEQATSFELHRQLEKVGKPVDRGEWFMTPPTINAYYDPQMNTINFPAGILQPPQFEAGADPAVNYGNIGATVGHELTHGFDDEGRKFDANGNLRNWWTADDIKAYEERGSCIAQQYTQPVPEAGPGVKQDGRLTQGEDTADNGGTRLAYAAMLARMAKTASDPDRKGPDGWTSRQRYFLSYATSWCSNRRAESIRTLVLTNPHSLERYRLNNVVADMPEFAQAFSCRAGQAMVRKPACRVW
jgi:putative endopeptidase